MFNDVSGDLGAGWGQGSVTSTAAEPAAAEDTDAGWYAVIDDSQVGPMALSELERQWEDQELNADTLVWKPGMTDWASIADVPELSVWITEKPQGVFTTDVDTSGMEPTSSGAAYVPAAAPAPREIVWRSSTAKDLATLVQEEMGLSQAAPVVSQPIQSPQTPVGLPSMAVPGLGGVDLFAPAGANPAAGAVADPLGFNAAGMGQGSFAQPFGAPPTNTQGWVVPAPTVREPRGVGWIGIVAVIGVLGLAVVAVGGTLIFAQRMGFFDGGPTPPERPAVAAVDPATSTATAKPPVEPPKVETKTEAPAPKVEAPAPKPVVRTPTRPKPKPKPKAQSTRKPDKAKLGIKDIVDGVKKNAKKVAPCLKNARRAGEIIPGKYKLILNWTILPNGKVSSPKVKGPSKILGTSLATCVPNAMRKWKFPSSNSGAPVKNFPFGPFTVR